MFYFIVSRLKKEGESCGRCSGRFCQRGCNPVEGGGQDCGKCEKGLVCRRFLTSGRCTKALSGNFTFIIRIGLKLS